jgi:ABC-type polysaccharide/polyol phosphate export permease
VGKVSRPAERRLPSAGECWLMMTRLVQDCREMLAEQFEFRELLYRMSARDLVLRYKQTVMGFGWAIFMPLVNTVVFSVIFTRVAPIKTPVPYPVFAYCGLWVWNFFASSLRFSVVSLTGNPNLVSKVFFPREIFPFAAVIVSLVDFAVAGVVLVGLMVYYRIVPSSAIFLLPAVLIVHVAFTTAVGLLLAMANLFYRDVKYLFELVLTVWMFASSVLYPLDFIGGHLGTVIRLNPMTWIIDAYRAALLNVPFHNPLGFAMVAAGSFAFLATAWLIFHRGEYLFAENL